MHQSLFKFIKVITVDINHPHMPADEDAVIDLTSVEGKKQIAAERRNALAMTNLTMTITSEGTMGWYTRP